MRWLYTLLLYLLMPLVVLRLLWLSRRIPGYRERISERFGFVDKAGGADIAVWIHAVSVGESMAALPLVLQLLELHGEGRVWVTTTTPTGSERIRASLGTRVRHSYLPYDLPGGVARFLEVVRPVQAVFMETEIWPNLFHSLGRRKIPLTIANARLSPRSFRGYGRLPAGTMRRVLADVSLVAAQSEADAQRFHQLGAPRVEAVGNLKFDIDPPADQLASGAVLRERLGRLRPIWIAASTHEYEEDAALTAHALVRRTFADALLILVPRHPQRFDGVARLLERSGMNFLRRSQSVENLAGQPAVFLGDSLGEMWMYLAAADLAFVGGSLVPVGGHNVLEPAALGLPVLFGAHMHNFVAARDLLLSAQAAEALSSGADLAHSVQRLLADPARRAAMGAAGRAAVLANRGALQRLLQRLSSHTIRA